MAAEYGWTARTIDAELTDELLVMYLDAATDRVKTRVQSDIEAIRVGTIFAHDPKAHASWLRRLKSPAARGLAGAALERAVGAFAMTHPEYVVRERVH